MDSYCLAGDLSHYGRFRLIKTAVEILRAMAMKPIARQKERKFKCKVRYYTKEGNSTIKECHCMY